MIRIPAGQLTHEEPHDHGGDFHFCEKICPRCEYYCHLPRGTIFTRGEMILMSLGHPQLEHQTSHGSMKKTTWWVENDGVAEISGRRYATGDSGSAMLCSLVCNHQGRHSHLVLCQRANGGCQNSPEIEHAAVFGLTKGASGKTQRIGLDWVTHRLYWECSSK